MSLKKTHLLLILNLVLQLGYSQKIEIYNTDINSIKDDYAPSFYQNGLAITSNKKNAFFSNTFEKNNKSEQDDNLSNIYLYEFTNDNVHFKDVTNGFIINIPDVHNGPCSFSSNYDTIFFAKTIPSKNSKKKSTIGIFYSTKTNDLWSPPTPLNFNSETYNFSHPCISPNGKTLYYVSDIPKGIGKKDIWYSIKKSNHKWSQPINIGTGINTTSDEIFPFISKESVLYFSSNRYDSYGGYDIYFKNINLNGKTNKMPYPINTEYNDFGFITKDNGKTGYLSSNRKNNIDDDIYYFNRITDFSNCEETSIPKYCFTFYDTDLYKLDPHVKHIWNFGVEEGQSHEKEPMHCFKSTGNHNIRLSLVDTLTGVVIQNVSNYQLLIPEVKEFYFDKKTIEPDKKEYIHLINTKL